MDIDFIMKVKAYRKEYHQSRKEFAAKQFLSGLFRQFEAKTYCEYSNCKRFIINNYTYAEYNKKYKNFYYDYNKIYLVLNSEFDFNEQKINELILIMVKKYLKFGKIKPDYAYLGYFA